MQSLHTIIRVMLALMLALTAVAKLTSGAEPTALLSSSTLWVISLVELIFAALLVCRCDVLGASGTAVLAVSGAILAYLYPHTPCMCLGLWWKLGTTSHLILSGTMTGLEL